MIIPPKPNRRSQPTTPRPEPVHETKPQVLAAHFEEVARMLRKNPELFSDEGLAVLGVVAGLSTNTMRKVARNANVDVVFGTILDVGPQLLSALVKTTRGNRKAWRLLGGLRHGWNAAMVANKDRDVTNKRREFLEGERPLRAHIVSSCPRCDHVNFRDLFAPAPCQCGFVFEAIDEEEDHG